MLTRDKFDDIKVRESAQDHRRHWIRLYLKLKLYKKPFLKEI